LQNVLKLFLPLGESASIPGYEMKGFIAVTDNESGMAQGTLVQYASHCTGQAGLKAQGNQI